MNASLSYSRAVIYCSELSGIMTVIVLFLIIKIGKWLWWIEVLAAILPKVLSSGTRVSRKDAVSPVGFAGGEGLWRADSDAGTVTVVLSGRFAPLLLGVTSCSCSQWWRIPVQHSACPSSVVAGMWLGGMDPRPDPGQDVIGLPHSDVHTCWLWWFIPGRVCDIIESDHCGARMRTETD